MIYYHASPVQLNLAKLEPNRLFFISNHKEYVINEFLFGRNYKFLYEIELKKSKIKSFDILKAKHFKIWKNYCRQEYGQYDYKMLNTSISNGRLAFYTEDEILPILQENNLNSCLFDEIGAASSVGEKPNEWREFLQKEYGNIEINSIGIIDPKIIKKIKLEVIRCESNELVWSE